MGTCIKIFCLVVVGFCLNLIDSEAQFRTSGYYDELTDSEVVKSLKSHIRYLSSASMEGRKAGSEGEKAAADYLRDALEEVGVDVLSPEGGDLFGWRTEQGDTLTSRNVIGFLQGYDPQLRDRFILVGARMDNLGSMTMTVDGQVVERIYSGANGNASGMAMLIELARKIKTNEILFRRSVLFVGLGASSQTYAGSWYFLNRAFSDSDRIDAMINLDGLGLGSLGFYAYTSSNADVNALINRISADLQPVLPKIIAAEPYPSDHRAFYSKEIPSVMFSNGKYSERNTVKDTESIIQYEYMEKELEYIFNFTVEIANTEASLLFRKEDAPKRSEEGGQIYSFYDCDQRPMFLNSPDPRQFLEKWVYHYLKYPEIAVREGIQGKVMVNFVIEKDGKVTDVRVVKSVSPELDEEALKVVSASPKWRPGRINGQKVRSSMTIPVEFRLQRKGTFGIKR